MEFDWRWGLGTVGVLWLVGAVCTAVFMFLFGPRATDNDARDPWTERLRGSLVLSFFIWPFLLPTAFHGYKFRRSIRIGKRPAWLVYADGESESGNWTLSDGTEVLASAYGGSPDEPCQFLADYASDDMTGQIQFRVRMIAPTLQSGGEWHTFSFTDERPSSHEDADAEESNTERYEASLTLPPGKYAVDFRIQNRSGTFEERSGVTMIVADPTDYD